LAAAIASMDVLADDKSISHLRRHHGKADMPNSADRVLD
jgi:hypothetical protein